MCVYAMSFPAGNYECTVSGVRWVCNSDVTLKYSFRNWDCFKADYRLSSFTPIGPLMDITVLSGEIKEAYMPLFFCLGGSYGALKKSARVLHWSENGLTVENCELLRFHAKLLCPTFSPIVVVSESEASASSSRVVPGGDTDLGPQMTLHWRSLIFSNYVISSRQLTLRVYIFPCDSDVIDKVTTLEKEQRSKMIPTYMNPFSLQRGDWFKFKTSCENHRREERAGSSSECHVSINPNQITIMENQELPKGYLLTGPIFTKVYKKNPSDCGDITLIYEQNDIKEWEVEIIENDYNPLNKDQPAETPSISNKGTVYSTVIQAKLSLMKCH